MSNAHIRSSRGIPRHSATPTRHHMWVARTSALVVGIVLFVTTAGILTYFDLQSALHSSSAEQLLGRAPDDSYTGRDVNILVLGTDTRQGKGNNVDSNNDPTQRSDTTMVVHLSKDRSRATIVSIPRDTLVSIPSCTRADGTHSRPQHAQFNWAYQIGGEDGSRDSAIACTMSTVQKITGLYIDDFVLVDFNGFHTMINALGGIKIYVDSPINDPNYSTLRLDAGCTQMDGDTALKYARVRHGITGGDGSDIQRIGRQQHVMSVMFRTAQQKNILTNLPSLYQFGRAGLSALTTSKRLGSLTTLAGLAYSLHNIRTQNILFVTAPVTEAPRDPNRVIFQDRAQDLWDALDNDAQLPAGLEVSDAAGTHYVTHDTAPTSQTSTSSPNTDSPAPTPSPSQAPTSSSISTTSPMLSAQEKKEQRIEKLRAQCEP